MSIADTVGKTGGIDCVLEIFVANNFVYQTYLINSVLYVDDVARKDLSGYI
jgi:hypothetical protein